MNDQERADYYASLERRLMDLGPALERWLAPEVQRWFSEFADAGEYGLATELAAEALAAMSSPPVSATDELLAIAATMGLTSGPIIELAKKVGKAG